MAPEKDDLTEHQYEIYQKTHNDEHPLDEERAKIGREKGSYARRRRQSEERLKRRLNEIARPDDAEAWEEDPAQVEEDERATRDLRNAHTHKRRLKGLARHVEGSGPAEGDA